MKISIHLFGAMLPCQLNHSQQCNIFTCYASNEMFLQCFSDDFLLSASWLPLGWSQCWIPECSIGTIYAMLCPYHSTLFCIWFPHTAFHCLTWSNCVPCGNYICHSVLFVACQPVLLMSLSYALICLLPAQTSLVFTYCPLVCS